MRQILSKIEDETNIFKIGRCETNNFKDGRYETNNFKDGRCEREF